VLFFIVILAAAYEFSQTILALPPTVEIIYISESTNVTCNGAFTLVCVFNKNVSCTWKRNGAVIDTEESGRYSSQSSKHHNKCTFATSAAVLMDSGNWTCGTLADDFHDGITSNNITVNVTGPNCIPASIESTNAPSDQVTTLDSQIYIYIIVAVLLVLFIIIIIYLWYSRRKLQKNDNVNKPMAHEGLHIYDEIDDNPSFQSGFVNGQVQPGSSKVPTGKMPIRIKEILDYDGYQIPMSPDGSILIKEGYIITAPETPKVPTEPELKIPELPGSRSDSDAKAVLFKNRLSASKLRSYENITSWEYV